MALSSLHSWPSKHKLCSALMWAQGYFCTWRSPKNAAHFLDHIIIPRKHLHRAERQGRHASAAKTDHLGVCLHLQSEAKLLPKDLDQSHTPGDGRCRARSLLNGHMFTCCASRNLYLRHTNFDTPILTQQSKPTNFDPQQSTNVHVCAGNPFYRTAMHVTQPVTCVCNIQF